MKILIIDDHAVVRDGVKRLLSTIPGAVLLAVETSREALAVYRAEKPDVIVLDINLHDGSGLELLRRYKAENPDVRVVIFSMYSDVVYAASARRAGALGYVSKSAPSDELITAVKHAIRGKSYVDGVIAEALALTAFSASEQIGQLSSRELEILRLLADGNSLSEIADLLGVAYKTVANTCTRIKEKLGIERTADLIRLVIENRHTRIIDIDP